MCRAQAVFRAVVEFRRGASVNLMDVGLVLVIVVPLAVVLAMICWPSDYDE
ncbi:Uncharacterised protein [Mycobacteroides abscessus subsp. abscessus]|nr:Uncharacterised protein [Mycobacteroides abscessus subsp. abscessus]